MHLTDICRVCLIKTSKTSDELFFPIDEAFEKKFNEITNTILHKSQECPTTVCISCVSELEGHYNYRCGLIAKQKRLNALLGVREESEQIIEKTLTFKEDPEEEVDTTLYTEESHLTEEPQIVTSEEEEHIEEILEQDNPEEMDLICDEDEMIKYEQVQQGDSCDDYELDETEYVQEDNDSNDQYFVEEDESFIIIDDAQSYHVSEVKQKRKYIKQSKDTAKQFKCWVEDCTSLFSFRATLRKHMLSVHQLECDKSTCLICGKLFEEYSQFLAHIKIHTRKSECDICKLRFVNDEKMQAHRTRVHANDFGERRYPCEFCNALFKRREHVNSHVLYKHTSTKAARRFHCKECSSSFLTRQDMKNHEKSHGQVKIKCCYCEYECRDLKSIRRHSEKIHQTNKIYKCKCSSLFELYKELQAHKKVCFNENVDSTTKN